MCPTTVAVDCSGVCTHRGPELRVSRPFSGCGNDCIVAQPLLLLGTLEGETRS